MVPLVFVFWLLVQIFCAIGYDLRGYLEEKVCLNYDDGIVAPDRKRGMHSGLHQRTRAGWPAL